MPHTDTHSELEAARDRLSDQVFGAHTFAEIAAAKEALRRWLREHPDEPGMADGFEVLSHAQDYAGQREAEGVTVARPETHPIAA